MNVLVVAFSGLDAAKYSGRREMVRRTWFAGLRDLGYDPKFVFSKGDLPKDYRQEDCIVLDGIPETWDALPQKTLAVCRWALQKPDWKYLAKFDDDSLVIPQRFHEAIGELRSAQYTGGDVGTCQGMPPYASGGAGYILRADAVHVAAAELEKHETGHEDVIVGRAMAAAGVPFIADRRFSPWPGFGIPGKDNDLISGHALTSEMWWRAWQECVE